VEQPVVALDAMGGDHAPAATVEGALRAHDEHGVRVTLVGRPDAIEPELARLGRAGALPVVPAPDVVGMDEDAALALRSKPRASVRVAADLVATGDAAALLSAGSTGATLAAALFAFGRLEGVRRPAVAAAIPVSDGRRLVLVDAGATPDAEPELLVGHARMGLAYAQALGVTSPTAGLLNIGAEPGKGNALARDASESLTAALGPAFAGNVEPAAALDGAVDVLVADGFTGNIFLKTVEALRPVRDVHTGAALLLGVRGCALVAHGAAAPAELAAALRTAAQVSAEDVTGRVAAALAAGAAA
jgi:glycerol-3-phosphate acyltransferase PlsX